MVKVLLQPEGETVTFTKINTALQLLNKYNLHYTDALVIRDGELLTQDRKINKDDEIILRKVVSVG
ncbi:hypothetical protein [Maridesulfovibrio ferrireducens]|jgi:sulfur carrier protein|uniref:Sulfur carrier protein n=1 Tax=Maridesulfovibrio ferrireducens TaxID=246191 RepID=A0A1G9FE90_9BACT|nr:hypothetical protein [Maridesulfovibrio ferrireducens]MBI9110894.1 hypothetical protein [Maridesulfovibrio ferrireducens]SDK86689.1 sulfur carrier protein [Maridesulfovibrio ferrireducens]